MQVLVISYGVLNVTGVKFCDAPIQYCKYVLTKVTITSSDITTTDKQKEANAKQTGSLNDLMHRCRCSWHQCPLVNTYSPNISNMKSINVLLWYHCVTYSPFIYVSWDRQLDKYAINASIGVQSMHMC